MATTTRPTPQPTKPNKRLLRIGLAVSIATVGLVSIQSLLARAQYEKGQAAYEVGQCEGAIAELDAVLKTPLILDLGDYKAQATAKKAECQKFQAAISHQTAGRVETALLSYSQFLSQYPNSALNSNLRQQAQSLFAKKEMKAIATTKTCDKTDLLTKQNLVPEQSLPAFYYQCGQTYAAKKAYSSAVRLYEQFLQTYPTDQLAPDVKAALAKSMVAEARAKGAGNIATPGVSGYNADGSTTVVVRNDSNEKIQLVFSGPEPRFEELAPCTDCQEFTGSPPKSCPSKGPQATYTLQPGQYEVVVKSVGRYVKPYTGNWSLNSGAEYDNCFYIVKNPSGT